LDYKKKKGEEKNTTPYIHKDKKMPLLESSCCSNCHRLIQRIAVLETKLIAGPPNQNAQQSFVMDALCTQLVSLMNLVLLDRLY